MIRIFSLGSLIGSIAFIVTGFSVEDNVLLQADA
jgi:hypothetical protein